MENQVYMGTLVTSWQRNKKIKTITFNVTDDCNLACTYCYFVHKTCHHRMDFSVACKAVDYILSNEDFLAFDGVVWDFIGGEPTLEAKLINQICDYIVERMYDLNHKWLCCYKFMMCSNGLLYSSEPVQRLVSRHNVNIQIAITIDGSKEKHDLSRVRKDGSGSYDHILTQLPLWFEQQNLKSTKSTFAHADLPYLKDSIISLWNLGIECVMANVVFEDCWESGDDVIFEEQLKALADYVIENELWDKYSVRFFDPNIGHPLSKIAEKANYCGAGVMMAVSPNGDIYPCARFLESSLESKDGIVVGNISSGIDSDKLRPFYALDAISQSKEECLRCEVASGCAWCTGNNYGYATVPTIFERQTFVCKMHKANVRAAEYFWKKYEEKTHKVSPMREARLNSNSNYQQTILVLLDNQTDSICQYKVGSKTGEHISAGMLKRIVDFCDEHHYVPIFVGEVANQLVDFGFAISSNNMIAHEHASYVVSDNVKSIEKYVCRNVIYRAKKTHIEHLHENILHIYTHATMPVNVNLFFEDLHEFSEKDFEVYRAQLALLSNSIFSLWEDGILVNLNVLTHLLQKDYMGACPAGRAQFTIAPDGNFYMCPAFYYDESMRKEYVLGNLDEGIDYKYAHLCNHDKCNGCRNCGAKQCLQCVYSAKKYTGEFCVPSEAECVKSNIERLASVELYNKAKMLPQLHKKINDTIDSREYYDPIAEAQAIYLHKYYKKEC